MHVPITKTNYSKPMNIIISNVNMSNAMTIQQHLTKTVLIIVLYFSCDRNHITFNRILTVHYLSRIFCRAICIVWHCKFMQDPFGSKEVSTVSALYIFLFFHLFFLIHPSFQIGINYNLFGTKMHVPGNCLPHSTSSACMILYCLWCCCCLCI